MTTRRDLIATALLAGTQWENATRQLLAGDASNRRYDRVTDPATGRTAVLMDAPPEKGEDVRPFVKVARYLRKHGLSAPEIYGEDSKHGFLLLEDLGDALFARVIPEHPDLEPVLYETATDLLVSLYAAPLPRLKHYGPSLMADLAGLAFTKYADGITGEPHPDKTKRFVNRFAKLLHDLTPGRQMVIQRDYHAENLIWLPDRDGIARVGLLDFQDAMIGHPAYDLVSLLQDIRRDVPARIEMEMIQRFVEKTGIDDHAFRVAYAALGVQRNMRILGVFARLGREYGKPRYVDMIPKVWAHLMRDLEHPALASVAGMIRESLPVPSAENLEKLKP